MRIRIVLNHRMCRLWTSLAAIIAVWMMGATVAVAQDIAGTYAHVRDFDGTVPKSGASVTLTFTGGASGSVTLRATQPGETVTDTGTYSIHGNLITIRFNEVGWAAGNQHFQFDGCTLILPFKALSATPGPGTSTWRKQDSKCGGSGLGGFAAPGAPGAPAAPGAPGTGKGNLTELVGQWTGRGAGEEVRSRRPRVMTLTVKHNAEFFFHISGKGEIQGEGTIEYDLTQDTTGLDSLVASVRAAAGIAAGMPTGVPGQAAKTMGDVSKAPGVGLQYTAPHLKYGKEVRHFKFQGRLEKIGIENGIQQWRMYLDQVGDFPRPNGKVDNQLIAAWEVQGVKGEKPFPCWSPFLKNPGMLRRGPGGTWVVEFQETGTHRNGVKPWQEYSYVWMARQIK